MAEYAEYWLCVQLYFGGEIFGTTCARLVRASIATRIKGQGTYMAIAIV